MGGGTFGDWMAIDDQDPHRPDVVPVLWHIDVGFRG